MPSWSTFAVFVPAALVLLVVPGPAVVYIVTRSVDQGRAAGIASTLGVTTGSVVHVFGAALGVSIVLTRSAEVFTVMKLAGAAYLVVLGVRRFVGTASADAPTGKSEHSLRRLYGQGVVVQTLNPKVAIFFLAFLPQFVDPARGAAAVQTLVLGFTFALLGMLSDGTYSIVASSIASRLTNATGRTVRQRLDRASGVVYVGLGVLAAVTRRPVERTA
jgi:threonine/homoserine/homoserine lactone efflux protein